MQDRRGKPENGLLAMRRVLALFALIVGLVCSSPLPAAAQTWSIQLRYWPTMVTGDYAGTVVLYNTYFWGLSLRHSFANDAWAASLNFDTGSMTYPGLGSGQSAQMWNLNFHRNFPFGSGILSAYVGWGSLSYQAPNSPGGPLSQSQQGFRAGADLRIDLSNGWYIWGDLGFGPSGSAEFTNVFGPGTATVQAQFLDARLAVGHQWEMWGFEAGYRWLSWNYTPGPNTCPTSPCQDRWAGWFLGANFHSP